MELNRELSQHSWQEVKHYVLADSFRCQIIYLVLSSFTPTLTSLFTPSLTSEILNS